jgi:hypothetical protein
MPVLPVTCPNGHHMTLPDPMPGKHYRCPMCGDQFEVPAAAIAAEAPPAAPTRPTEDDPERVRWAWTRAGLGFHYARLVVVLLSFLAYLFALILQSVHAIPVAAVLVCSSVGESLVGPALGLVGSFLCLRVPRDTDARGFIIASLLLDMVVIPFTTLQYTGVLAGLADVVGLSDPLAVLIVFGLLQMADWALYLFFQRRLALTFDDANAADEAVQILVRGLLLVVGPVLAVFGFMALLTQVPLVGCLMFPTAYLLLFVLAVLYVNFLLRQLALIASLRGLIRRAAY